MECKRQVPVRGHVGGTKLPIDQRCDRAAVVNENILEADIAMVEDRGVSPAPDPLEDHSQGLSMSGGQKFVRFELINPFARLQFTGEIVCPALVARKLIAGPVGSS